MFHDPTFFGWLTTGMYVAAAALCAVVAVATPGRTRFERGVRMFWLALTLALAMLAVNKQLDLQTALTDRLRDNAEHNGWYAHRRMWQAIFVVTAAALAGGGLWLAMRLLGQRWREHRLVLAGIAVLLLYLLLRTADIERIGEMTGFSLAAHRVRGALEWAGLLMIAAAAWRRAVDKPA